MAKAKSTPQSSQPKYQKLDGKPLSKPRGRHAVARRDTSDSDADEGDARVVTTLPVNRRLGFRIGEFAAMLGVSNVSIWRGINAGKIPVVDQAGIKIIPRAYAIKAGFITVDDDV